jgi:TolB-like protein/AraC-like DNA-binding protein
MSEIPKTEDTFLSHLTAQVEKNLADEQFGVSELASAMNMSRSNLLRKVKKETRLSASQFINQVRLKQAMEMLRKTSLNVSEVSHKVGFNSPSYFIKCFREYYGYPPGEVGKRSEGEPVPLKVVSRKRNYLIAGVLIVAGVILGGLLFFYVKPSAGSNGLDKSIAVLPFKNESSDSANVYLINGLMESTLNNLQQIKDLKVISRTTTERYRNTTKSIPEMAKELNVNYFVEGSGQKIGDNILLNIQLIDAVSDRHLWARQYRREAKDIFELQQEVARNIAQEIRAIITPEEKQRIEKNPTENLEAYDNYLKGRDLFYESTSASLNASLPYFKKAIELDDKFALAYANLVMVYYYLDFFHVEKRYGDEVDNYSDKAMLYDPGAGESLIAKALSFAYKREFKMAVPYLERALALNANPGLVLHFLTEFHSLYIENPGKYIEYAWRSVEMNVGVSDSATVSFKYFHLANAFINAGFLDEGIACVEKSMAYNPQNTFAGYAGILFRFAKHRDLGLARKELTEVFNRDTTRVDIAKELAMVSYTQRDYLSARRYFEKVIALRKAQHLDLYREVELDMAIVFSNTGERSKAEEYANAFRAFAENDSSVYHHAHLAVYFVYRGETNKAVEHLRLFSQEDNYRYWILLMPHDPLMETIKDRPDFKKVMHDIESKFWRRHEEIKVRLTEEGILPLRY